MQATHNPALDEIYEEIAQMITELGLVLKHIAGGADKVNAVNYLTKPPLPAGDYYYEEDSYVVNEQTRVFNRTPNAPIRKIGAKVNEIKVKTMGITIERDIMFQMETTTATKTSTGVTMIT